MKVVRCIRMQSKNIQTGKAFKNVFEIILHCSNCLVHKVCITYNQPVTLTCMVTSPGGDSGAPECIRFEPKTPKTLKNPKFREPSQNLPLVLWRCWEHFVSSLWGLWSSVIGWEVIPELFCVSAPASETEFYIGFWYTISASEAATWGSNRLGYQRLIHCMDT